MIGGNAGLIGMSKVSSISSHDQVGRSADVVLVVYLGASGCLSGLAGSYYREWKSVSVEMDIN